MRDASTTPLDHVPIGLERERLMWAAGIGFLGAGSLIARGQAVRGLTGAASIGAVAAVVLAAGLSAAIVLAIVVGVKPPEEACRARVQSCTLESDHEQGAVTLDDLGRILGDAPGVHGGGVGKAEKA